MRKCIFSLCIVVFFSFLLSEAGAASYSRLIKRGNRFFKNDLYSDALTYYIQGKERNKKAIEPVFNSGAAYYKMDNYIKSIESFSEILKRDENKIEPSDAYFNLGNTYYKLGDYMKAVENYKKGLEIQPKDLNLKYNLELALKKLKAQEKNRNSDKNEEEAKKGERRENGEKKPGETTDKPADKQSDKKENMDDANREKQSDQKSSEKQDLSRDEAERLIRSLNTDQSQTIGEIIKQRVSKIKNEKDW